MVSRSIWVAVLAAATAGCVSTTVRGYQGGKLKYSEVKYDYTAKPVLSDPAGKTYSVNAQGAFTSIGSVGALEKKGVKRADANADVVFHVKEGGAPSLEAGGFGMAAPFKPAVTAKMPIDIVVKDKAGNVIAERKAAAEEVLLNDALTFKTREEAKKAAEQMLAMGAKAKAEDKVRQSAARSAAKSLDLLAKDLFEPRKVSVALPALRAAGGVDMEQAYLALSKAKGEEQVKAALAAYSSLGTDHKKADGTPDVVANYGVRCGLASAKILVGDLSGAWDDTKAAWQTMPEGQEHRMIARVLHQQQQQAGVEIIPKEDYDAMAKADVNAAADQLKALFNKKEK